MVATYNLQCSKSKQSLLQQSLLQLLKALELLTLKFDIKNLANCVSAMLIFQGPIFWQRKTKNDYTRIRTTDP